MTPQNSPSHNDAVIDDDVVMHEDVAEPDPFVAPPAESAAEDNVAAHVVPPAVPSSEQEPGAHIEGQNGNDGNNAFLGPNDSP
jgi:hypothetical protein